MLHAAFAICQTIPPPKVLKAVFTEAQVKIDGDLTEDVWNTADTTKHFTEFRPANGNAEAEK